MIVASPSQELKLDIIEHSHGTITLQELNDCLDDGVISILDIEGKLFTGIATDEDSVTTFGFHGEISNTRIDKLDKFMENFAKENNLDIVRFGSTRQAWTKLLKAKDYKPVYTIYERKL